MSDNDYPNIPIGYDEEVVCEKCKKPFKKHLLAFKVNVCNLCKVVEEKPTTITNEISEIKPVTNVIDKEKPVIVKNKDKEKRKKYIRSRRAWLRKMRKINEDQWIELLDQIKNIQIRIQIACIVWWDFLANTPKVCKKLEKYKNQWKNNFNITREEIYDALIFIGYLPIVAKMRSERKDPSEYKDKKELLDVKNDEVKKSEESE